MVDRTSLSESGTDDLNEAGQQSGELEQDDAALEARAVELGWTPKEEYKGAKPWVDARTWVERGEQILPIMQAQNKNMKGELARERQARLDLERRIALQDVALRAVEHAQNEDVKQSYEDTRTDLKSQIAEASRAGDHELVADLVDKLAQLKPPPAATEDRATGSDNMRGNGQATLDPVFVEWQAANDWYGKDMRKSGLAEGIGRELNQRGLRGEAFYRELDKELAKEFRPARAGRSRVEGGHNEGGNGGNGGKSYHDLPADARRACDEYAETLVGPRKKFKDVNAWRASYAKDYFAGEQ